MKFPILELRQRKCDLVAEAGTLIDAAEKENRDLTEKEQTQYNALTKEIASATGRIERVEHQMDQEAQLSSQARAASGGSVESQEKKFDGTFGDWLIAVAHAGRTDGREVDPRLLFEAVASGTNVSFPSEGGFLIPQDFATEIIKHAHEGGQILSRVRRVPVSGNGLKISAVDEDSRANGSRWGGVQAFWANEADAATKSKPKWRQMDLNLHKLIALGYATEELLADAAAIQATFFQAFGEEIQFKAEDAIINGTGAGQPLGILTSGSLVSVAKETSQVAATFVSENAHKMWARMWSRSRRNAVWVYNQDMDPQLFQLNIKVKNVAGAENVGGFAYVGFRMAGSDGNPGPFHQLMGRPMIPVEYCATLGTKGDIQLCDFTQYLLIDKAPRSAVSMHVRFLNDEQTFRLTYRVDGQPIWNKPLTPFKGTNTLSPFISLDTRG